MAASPLVNSGNVILNVGGPGGAGLVAFDAKNGSVAWTATDDDAGYSSPIAATLEGRRNHPVSYEGRPRRNRPSDRKDPFSVSVALAQ